MKPYILCLLLAGCGLSPTTTIQTAVPIPIPCVIAPVSKPLFAIDALPPGSTLFEQVRSIWATLEQMESYAVRLEAAVASCS